MTFPLAATAWAAVLALVAHSALAEAPGVAAGPDAPPAPMPEGAAGIPKPKFQNSLGIGFVQVGDVLFAIWLTRVKDFAVYAEETKLAPAHWRAPGFPQTPEDPVVNVSWNDALAFCAWLTDREHQMGVLPRTRYYRLPTDREWSTAVGLPAEAGATPEDRDMSVPDLFPWGTQWPPPPNVGNYTGEETGSDVAIKGYNDGFRWTSPVGTFPANKFGLYDMGGNVWQWCMDDWSQQAATGKSKAKVLRGASWYNGGLKLSLLSSCRVHAIPESSTDNYGFRLVIADGPDTRLTQREKSSGAKVVLAARASERLQP